MEVHQEKPEPFWVPAFEKLVEFVHIETAMLIAISAVWMWRHFIFQPLYHKRLRLLKSVQEDRKIEALLYRILEKADADRVVLFQFHNGEKLFNERHYVYLSATHEAVKTGVAHASNQLQRVPISHLAKEIQNATGEQFHCFCTRQTANNVFRSYLAFLGVECSCLIMLVFEDRALGVLNLQYFHHPSCLDYQALQGLIDELQSILALPRPWFLRFLG